MRIYHNPRCSKSRQALALLRQQGQEPEVVLYLKDPPGMAELEEICRFLGVEPQQIVRSKERRWRELGLSIDEPRDRDEWLQLLVDNPALIERPIVVRNGRAVIGRPPERVLELL